jgi:hypothetical protein
MTFAIVAKVFFIEELAILQLEHPRREADRVAPTRETTAFVVVVFFHSMIILYSSTPAATRRGSRPHVRPSFPHRRER